MHALMVETLPGLSGGRFTEAFEKEFAVVPGYVVFAGDVEYFLLPEPPQYLFQCVEFRRLGKVCEIPGVENQVRLVDRGIDLIDSRLQGAVDVGIGGLVKADVAVADLNEGEVGGFGLALLGAKQLRTGHTSSERPR